MKKVTLADVAKRSGVSLTTVSQVLTNKPGAGIPAETRNLVLEAARELGYQFQPRAHVQHDLATIGVILRGRTGELPLTNPFYSHVYAGIEMACWQNHLNLLSATLIMDKESDPLERLRLLEEQRIDGLLLVGTFVNHARGPGAGKARAG